MIFLLYIYKIQQKNTIENLENVGYALEGHEGLYNIFMMEETQSIFAVGAGAVTKLVRQGDSDKGGYRIERIFRPKYPYEFLRNAEQNREGDEDAGKASYRDCILNFFGKN